MQEYDVALKLLLQGSAKLTIRELAGADVEKWLDIELPKVQNLRLDLLGETGDGSLIHVELQSGNDAAMPLRMVEYYLGVFRLFGNHQPSHLPQQIRQLGDVDGDTPRFLNYVSSPLLTALRDARSCHLLIMDRASSSAFSRGPLTTLLGLSMSAG